jgi:benzil reductase ((S)-benzoin forming)
MKKNIYIITGTSRGIGEAIARKLLAAGNVLYCISRNSNPRLAVESGVKGWKFHDLQLDLIETSEISGVMRDIFRAVDEQETAEISLINNAGVINPIREIGSNERDEAIIRSITVNLTAAMLVTDAFVHETEGWKCPRKVLNMSTGAARRPISGWSAYCAAKAGLEMYAHSLVLEQASNANPVKVVSFSPGVVDTEMQQEIRHANPEEFPELNKFVNYKKEGMLLNPGTVADTIIDLMGQASFGEKTLVSIRDIN